MRIVLFDQLNLPLAIPFLQPLLADDGRYRIIESFNMDQARDAVLLDELRAETHPVLFDASLQIIRVTPIYNVPCGRLARM